MQERWQQLAADPRVAQQAMGDLLRSPEQTVTLLRDRLLTPLPSAETCKQVEKLILDLNGQDEAAIGRARTQLGRMGPGISPLLWRAVHSEGPLAARPYVQSLLLLQEAEAPQSSAERARRLRGLQLLELVGTPAACQLLAELAGPEEPTWQRAEARRARSRLIDRGIQLSGPARPGR
jgi:hypothetical protein